MAVNSLKDLAKCLGLASENDKSLKEQALAALSAAKTALTNAITSIVGSVVDQFTSAIDALEAEWESAKTAYNDLKETLSNISLDGILSSVCEESQATDATKPKTDPVSQIDALPQTNNDDINKSSKIAEVKKEERKAATTGLKDQAKVIGTVDTEMDNQGIIEQREFRRKYINKHPSLDSYVSKLAYFQPVSEYVGSWILAYTPDKPSLQLANWSQAVCVRKNIQPKVRSDVLNVIQSAYASLNGVMYNNVSREFIEERGTFPYDTAHNYHMAGDELYYTNHTKSSTTLYKAYETAVGTSLGKTITQVNYLVTTTPSLSVSNNTVVMNVEGADLTVDLRGNPAVAPFTTVNNNVLIPDELQDE